MSIIQAFFIASTPTYSVSSSTSSVNEGSSVTFTVTTTNVPSGTTLYWSTNTVSGTINTSDFSGASTSGSFTINNNSGSIIRTLANDLTTEGSESFQLQIRTGSTSGTIVATSTTVTINDTSLNARLFSSVSPTVSGLSSWNLDTNGALILDGANSTSYTLVAGGNFSTPVVMWGQARTASNGGYSSGTVSFTSGTTYTIRLNTGAGGGGAGSIALPGATGTPGQSGGGYAGLFITSTINQTNAIMMAGGGGGSSGSGTAGGGGAGITGVQGTSNTPVTGGGGGSQTAGGPAGSGSGGPPPGSGSVASGGSALQGGSGGVGARTTTVLSGGGGGGGGYFGGGGGGGGAIAGRLIYQGAGGGGGSGYINPTYVTGGSTSTYAGASNPNRGTAGAAPGGPARIVISP